MDLWGEKVVRTTGEGGRATSPPEQPSAAHRDGMNHLKTSLCFMGALVSAAPLKLLPSSHASDGFWSNEMPGYIAGLSDDCPRCEDTGTDNLISHLISCNGNLRILLTQQKWQQILLFQLWVSTRVCNQYQQIRQQETTAAILAALTRSDPVSLPENS